MIEVEVGRAGHEPPKRRAVCAEPPYVPSNGRPKTDPLVDPFYAVYDFAHYHQMVPSFEGA